MRDEQERDKAGKTVQQMGSNCCLSLLSQKKSWLAGFLTVLKHCLVLDAKETAHLENEECSL